MRRNAIAPIVGTLTVAKRTAGSAEFTVVLPRQR